MEIKFESWKILIVSTSWLSCFCFVFSLLLLFTFFPHSLGNLCHPLVEVKKKITERMEPFSCLTYQWDLCNVTMFNADALKIDLLLLQAEGLKNEIVFHTPSF